ncbi:MAG: ABC transporter ATP-binding protein [Bacteroidales bacterium]
MEPVLLCDNLSKSYGKLEAVRNLNLSVNEGEIYGFLGLNGAGKTTTIRMLLGMIRPSTGRIRLLGEPLPPSGLSLWNRVGHLVEIPYAYPELSVRDNLRVFLRLRRIRDTGALDRVVDLLHLEPYLNIPARHLSLGNAQRLGLAKALIHRPKLLILDEPANGLDPEGIVQIRELLLDLSRNHGVTIFLSSHILGEIARFASRIGIIHQGRLIRRPGPMALDKDWVILEVDTQDNGRAATLLRERALHVSGNPGRKAGTLATSPDLLEEPERVAAQLSQAGWPPRHLVVTEEDLEAYFLRIIHTHTQP